MIEHLPNLTVEEQQKYIKAAQEGDEKAKEILIRSNIRLISSIIKPFNTSPELMADLMQEGCIGICIAIQKFDLSTGNRFSTYATWYIKKAIYDYLANETGFKIPNSKYFDAIKIKRTKEKITQTLKREPSINELAKECNLKPNVVKELLSITTNPVSLEGIEEEYNFVGQDFHGINHNDKDTFEEVEASITKKIITKALKTYLTPKENEIITLRFGLNGRNPMTLDEIGKKYGISRERVRQIEKKSLNKISSSPISQQLVGLL